MSKLKDRKHFLIANEIRETLMNTENDVDTLINVDHEIIPLLKEKFGTHEIRYTVRHLIGKKWLAPYGQRDEEINVKITLKGIEEWLFPTGQEDPRKIFLSHASEDKILAGELKKNLEKYGVVVFLAHDDIPGTYEFKDKLISELKTCGVLIALRTKNFRKPYTEQECGFALAFNKRILPLCIGTEPSDMGFLASIQGGIFLKDVAMEIVAEYCTKQLLTEIK